MAKKCIIRFIKAKTTIFFYKDLVNDNNYVVPIAHETMGSWAPDCLEFMKDLGSRVSEATGEKCAKSFLFQSLSMNLQRGNALCNGNSSSLQKTGQNLQSRKQIDFLWPSVDTKQKAHSCVVNYLNFHKPNFHFINEISYGYQIVKIQKPLTKTKQQQIYYVLEAGAEKLLT